MRIWSVIVIIVMVVGCYAVGQQQSPADGSTVRAEEYTQQAFDYHRAVVSAQWRAAWTVEVSNPAGRAQTVAVVVDVDSAQARSVAAVDQNRNVLLCQADDLDNDGLVDEAAVLVPLAPNTTQNITILAGDTQLGTPPGDLVITEHQAGSWQPVRMQPTRSVGANQHSTYISPTNSQRARQVMERLGQPVAMRLIECADFRLLIGEKSGLIEGMRPGNIPDGYVGSFLREYVPNEAEMGSMVVRCAGPVRCVLEWPEAGRRIAVYRNGIVDTTWQTAPSAMQIVACAYPYSYLSAGGEPPVRYDQMLEKRRDLPGVSSMVLFGKRDASLNIQAKGLQATDHQVWLDSGEIGWEVAVDYTKGISDEDPYARVARLCSDTYVAGGMHVTEWKGADNEARVTYRIAQLGEDAARSGTGLRAVAWADLDNAAVPPITLPEPPAPVQFAVERTDITVNRLYPNHFNGWELRPLVLAKHNPQPAYFAAEIINDSDEEVSVNFSMPARDWIKQATILWDRQMLEHDKNPGAKVVYFAKEGELLPAEKTVTLSVPAGSRMPVEVFVRPKEDTLGTLDCRLNWESGEYAGSTALRVVVRPTLLYAPNGAPCSELGQEYANLTRQHPPRQYDVVWYGGSTPERDRWMLAKHRDYERHGFWSNEPMQIKAYFSLRQQGSPPAVYRLEPLEFACEMAKLLRNDPLADYWAQIYTHDEIWEIFGGYKGRWRYLPDLIDIDRIILRSSSTPVWPSFQEPALDEQFQYHIKLPCDIAETFYYCGQDSRLQEYARKVVEPRQKLFKKWCDDPGFMVGAGTDNPKQLFSFWISTQLHVTRYESVRRQIWWLRYQGFDIFRSWAFSGGYKTYADRILHWILMPAAGPEGRTYLLTDRALAWMDMKEDMDLVTLVRLLSADIEDEAIRQRLDELASQALQASQTDDFAQARNCYLRALDMLRPDLAYLAPGRVYTPEVSAEPLPDLFARDGELNPARELPQITLSSLEQGGQRPRPTLDGLLDNSYLEQGATLNLHEAVNAGRLKAPTSTYLAYDADNLYVLFICSEPMMKQLRAEAKERDSEVYSDDCVEIFVQPPETSTINHFIVNAAGVKFDQRDGDRSWNPEYEVVARREKESWAVEFKIPWEVFGGLPQAGETWRMNFCRERKTESELGAWSVTFGGFLAPDRFGKVTFK